MIRPHILALTLLISINLCLKLENSHQGPFEVDFCWKDSYGRGVGTIPT